MILKKMDGSKNSRNNPRELFNLETVSSFSLALDQYLSILIIDFRRQTVTLI